MDEAAGKSKVNQENLVLLNELSEQLKDTEQRYKYFMEMDVKKSNESYVKYNWKLAGKGIPNSEEPAYIKHSKWDTYLFQGQYRYLMTADAFNIITRNASDNYDGSLYENN